MKAHHYNVRADRQTGQLFLVEERRGKPIKRLADLTQPILLALAADVLADINLQKTERDINFSDGGIIRISVEDISPADYLADLKAA